MVASRVVVLRHGQTDWNAAGRWQGQTDIPLNEHGRDQAACAAKRLAEVVDQVDVVVSSPQVRAVETASIVAEAWPGVTVQADDRLAEFRAGCFEGCTKAEIVEQWPELLAAFRRGEDVPLGGTGEKPSEVRARVGAAFADYAESSEGTVLLVAHGGALMNLANDVVGVPTGRAGVAGLANCHWGVFTPAEGQFRLAEWGIGWS